MVLIRNYTKNITQKCPNKCNMKFIKNKIKLVIYTSFLFILTLNSYAYAQVCSGGQKVTCPSSLFGKPNYDCYEGREVICPDGKTPYCSTPESYRPTCVDILNAPRCCVYGSLASKFNCGNYSDFTCALIRCPKTPECLSLCDPGYTVCISNNSVSCCQYGCCPLDPTRCKCANNDRCSPEGCPTYSCDPGRTVCPPNIAPTDPGGLCCLYGCCHSDPTKCKCPSNNQCSPNCSVPTYSCNSGLIICPNDTTPGALCCQYGCCPSDPKKCKCALNNQCFPDCTTSGATDCNSTYPSCNGTCPSGQACTVVVSGFTPGCSCLPTVSTTPTPTPITLSCPLPCSNSSACGSGKYCNLTTMCCTLNPSGCFKGCYLSSSECETSEECVSNCCIPLPPELVITGSESINLATRSKRYSIAITVTGLKFQSKSRCTVFTRNSNLRIKFNPTIFSLEAGKSSTTINTLVRKLSALRKTNLITVDVTCDNGTSANKTITVTH